MMLRLRQTVVLLTALALTEGFCSAATKDAIETLRGIQRVKVLIERLDSDATNYGITESELRTQAELELRRTGIRVADSDDLLAPTFYINLNIIRKDGFHAYHLEAELDQDVFLIRSPTIKAYGVGTWSSAFLGVAFRDVAVAVRTDLARVLERFLNDYLSVNPKQ
jgi:hypothetical protein